MEKTNKKNLIKKIRDFFIAGVSAALVDYLIYELVAILINNNDYLFIASIISGTIAVFVSFLLNNYVTWKNQDPGKAGIVKFFTWNLLKAVVLKPILTIAFGFLGNFYEFLFSISQSLGLPFDYNFIESTSIFCLVIASTMVLSYFVYDRLVFKDKKEKRGKQEDVESVRKSGKE